MLQIYAYIDNDRIQVANWKDSHPDFIVRFHCNVWTNKRKAAAVIATRPFCGRNQKFTKSLLLLASDFSLEQQLLPATLTYSFQRQTYPTNFDRLVFGGNMELASLYHCHHIETLAQLCTCRYPRTVTSDFPIPSELLFFDSGSLLFAV